VAKWDHTKHLRIVPVTGNVKQRLTSLMTPADVYTTNYEQLPWLVEHYGDRWPFKTVIADEQTRLKSYRTRQGSKRAKALAQVAHTKVNRFIGLTGTPSPNGLADLWGQTWFVDRGERLGRTYSAFEARWFKKGWDGFSVEPLPIAQKEIEGRLRDVCLTVTGLPVDEPIVNNIYIDLPSSARTLYNEMEREMFMEIEEHGIEALNAAAKTMKLLQVANGAAYIDDQKNWKEVHHEKIEALGSIVEEAAGAPVLVAYHFQSDHARLRAAFPKARTLDADPATIHQWNAGRIPILLAHPASAGHGLDLQYGGNILAFFSLNWSLENYMQIIERIGPMRQKQAGFDRPVFVHHIMAAKTVDDMVLERLASKRTVQEILLDAMKRRKQ
jgi:SNF2 family DNA or RNA helicase